MKPRVKPPKAKLVFVWGQTIIITNASVNSSMSEKHKIYQYAIQPSHSVMRTSTRDEIRDEDKENAVKHESKDSSGDLSNFNDLNFNKYLKELRSRKPDEFSKLMNEISSERNNERHRISFQFS